MNQLQDFSKDYAAALNSAALFHLERASTDIIEVKGSDAASFLSNISTNDIINLPVGESCETFFCDHRAKALFQANVRRRDQHTFMLDTALSYGEHLIKHLHRYLISESVEISTSSNGMLHLAGPSSGKYTKDWESIWRHDILGVEGYDIYVDSSAVDYLMKAKCGLEIKTGSPETFEILRIEAGHPIYGIDIDENRFVMEVANAARAVCYTKGCFIGQEPIVMSRDRAGQVNRLFLGMKVLDGGPLAHGTKLFRDGVEVGIVTSSCDSPRLRAPLALGYLKRPHIQKGLILTAGTQSVEVLGYPPLDFSKT